MTQEQKTLLLRDLCARLPYGVMMKWDDNYHEYPYLLERIDKRTLYCKNSGNDAGCLFIIGEDNFKPYLRPMSSMTEEERKAIQLILGDVEERMFFTGRSVQPYIWINQNSLIENNSIDLLMVVEVIDYLNSIHVDYRGLIPLGLAIAVTEENNPYKA